MKISEPQPEIIATKSSSAISVTEAEAATITTSTSSSDNTTIIKTKIENATEGLSTSCFNYLSNKVLPASKENALTICDYISSIKSEIN